VYFPETGSTNAELLRLAPDRLTHGMIAITDHQTAGRGRMARTWSAPPASSLLFSVALRWPHDVPLPQSVMLASLAVADTLGAHLGLVTEVKWPNDALVNGRKICGILGESAVTREGRMVVLGIGLNVNFDPADVPEIPSGATSLARVLGRPIVREDVFLALIENLDMWYRGLTRDRGAVFAAWSLRLDLSDKPVSVHDSGGSWNGTAVTVRPDGGLVVREENGRERLVYAADVSLRVP
jgi:BirA family biotin operon repressor/biotin-[acetyl-CoA-carboxylase] ligase